MKRLSVRVPVLYVNSIGMRMPSIRKDALFWKRIRRKLTSVARALQRVTPTLYAYSPLPLPLYQYNWGRALNAFILRAQLRVVYQRLGIRNPLVWVNTPTAWPVIATLPNRGVVYQRTDDYAAYDFENFNADYVREVDDELVRTANLILHVSEELHNQATIKTKHSLLLPQGVDEQFFAPISPPPEDLERIDKPIIGYVGGMDRHKFNTKLVAEVAQRLPDCSFVLVGMPNPNVESLHNLPNVYFLGVKRHDEIPAYVHGFDTCMLPTALTEWGLKCRPLKLMEYLAANKPVVATPTPASAQFSQTVFIADNAASWVEMIKLISSGKSSSATLPIPVNHRLTTWNAITDQLWARLQADSLLSGTSPTS